MEYFGIIKNTSYSTGTYCSTEFYEGCCSYEGFVCCQETTRGFCAIDAKYCPPSNLDGGKLGRNML